MSHMHGQPSVKPAFHRCADSLENFVLRFQVKELKNLIFSSDSPRSGNGKDSSGSSVDDQRPFSCNMDIKWQDKLYGPEEIHYYMKYKNEIRCPDSFREKKKLMQAHESKTGVKFEDLLQPTMIYTYIDNDNFSPESPATVVDGSGQLQRAATYLGGNPQGPSEGVSSFATHALSNAKKYDGRQNKENDSKKMYICIASNVDVEKIKNIKTMFLEPRLFFDENVLCAIDIIETSSNSDSIGSGDFGNDGVANDMLVVMTPSISPLLPENSSTPSILAATLDEVSSHSAVKQGLRLESYRISCLKGSEFLYTIENLNQKISPLVISSIEAKDRIMEKMSVLSNRGLEDFMDSSKLGPAETQSILADLWKQDPPKAGFDKSISYMAEIVSADGFDEEEGIFIEYFFSYTDGYSLRTGNRSDGADNYMKGETNPMLDPSAYDAESVGLMRGQTMISYSTSDNSSRHGLKLPRLRPSWDGLVFTSEIPFVSRAIIGYAFYIVSFLILLFDFTHPLFLFIAMVLLFYCMYASPNTAVQMVVHDDTVHNQSSGGSSGQAAGRSYIKSNMKIVGDSMTDTTFNINHPISASFDAKDQTGNDSFVSGQGPIIFFQVFGQGYLGAQTLIGYGFTQLPHTSGFVDVSINTWKPIGDSNSRMSELYLGTSTKLRHPNFIYHSKNSRIINKFGVTTETSGRIRFRCQAITTTHAHSILASPLTAPTTATTTTNNDNSENDSRHRKMTRAASRGSLKNIRASSEAGAHAVKTRDVDDILKEMSISGAFKGTTMTTTMSSSLSSSISSSSNQKIDDILAKAKAKRLGNGSHK